MGEFYTFDSKVADYSMLTYLLSVYFNFSFSFSFSFSFYASFFYS